MSLSDSKTMENLKAAFAGESQANRRYLYFASRKLTLKVLMMLQQFSFNSRGETGHAFGHLEFLASRRSCYW